MKIIWSKFEEPEPFKHRIDIRVNRKVITLYVGCFSTYDRVPLERGYIELSEDISRVSNFIKNFYEKITVFEALYDRIMTIARDIESHDMPYIHTYKTPKYILWLEHDAKRLL